VCDPTTLPNETKTAEDGHIKYRKNSNISVLDSRYCPQFRAKMQHGAVYGQQLQGSFQPTMHRERSANYNYLINVHLINVQ